MHISQIFVGLKISLFQCTFNILKRESPPRIEKEKAFRSDIVVEFKRVGVGELPLAGLYLDAAFSLERDDHVGLTSFVTADDHHVIRDKGFVRKLNQVARKKHLTIVKPATVR